MKIAKSVFMVLLVVTAMTLVGCGAAQVKDTENKIQHVYKPDWFDFQDYQSNYIYSYGKGTATYEETAMDIAKSNAWKDASTYIKAYVDSMQTRYLKDTGVENPLTRQQLEKISRVVSTSEFAGALFEKTDTIIQDGKYTSFVRLVFDKEAIDEKAEDMKKKEEEAITGFNADNAEKKMDEQIDKKTETK